VITFYWWHSGTKSKFDLLSLVLLTNRCAKGSFFGGTVWHTWQYCWI